MSLINYSTEKLLNRLLNNKSNKNYWNYISELRKRKDEVVFKRSIELTKSATVKEKIIGINILAQFGYPRLHSEIILKRYFDLLQTETNKNIISSILYGIGHNNENLNEKQTDIICSFKKHKSVNVRYSVVCALLSVDKSKAIDTLIELSVDKDADIRNWAVFGLGTQIEKDNNEIREALWKRVNDADKTTKFEAIAGLAKRKDGKIKELLKEEFLKMNDSNPLLLEAIEKFCDKVFIVLIEEKISRNKTLKKVDDNLLFETLEKLKVTV